MRNVWFATPAVEPLLADAQARSIAKERWSSFGARSNGTRFSAEVWCLADCRDR